MHTKGKTVYFASMTPCLMTSFVKQEIDLLISTKDLRKKIKIGPVKRRLKSTTILHQTDGQ